MIISNNPTRLTCPHCGSAKYIQTIVSGNGFGARNWSDGRWYSPMMEQPSPYQKCPKCRQYYSYSEAKPKVITLKSITSEEKAYRKRMERMLHGQSPFPAIPDVDPFTQKEEDKMRKEARRNGFGELYLEDLAAARKDILPRCKTAKQKKEYYLSFVHEYNDARTGRIDGGWVLMLEDYWPLFEEYAKELSVVRGMPQTINAEMCRELGQFDRAIEICHHLLDAGTDVEAVRQILAHAEAHDPEVFELQFEQKDLD